jgi:uncharacterized protein involved in response to NO
LAGLEVVEGASIGAIGGMVVAVVSYFATRKNGRDLEVLKIT